MAVREGTLLIDRDGKICDVRKAHSLIGLDEGDLVGGPPLPDGWTMRDEDERSVPAEEHPAMVTLRTGQPSERILEYVGPNPEQSKRLRFAAFPIEGDSDVAVDVVVSDANRRVDTRAAIESDDARFRTLTDMLPVSVWEATLAGEVTYVNPAFTQLTGLSAADTPDLPMLEIVHPDDVAVVMAAASAAADGGDYRAQYRVRHVDGSSRWVTSRMAASVSQDGKVGGFVGTIEDVDALRSSQQHVNRLAAVVEMSGDAVAIYEADELVFINAAASQLLERTDPSFASKGTHVFNAQIARLPDGELRTALRSGGMWSGDVSLFDAWGQRVHFSVIVTMHDVDDGVRRLVVQGRDIADRKQRENELVHSARHDQLTGLMNRVALDEQIDSTPPDLMVSVLYVDIDHFKKVNDELGHALGDEVLRSVAQRLRACVAATDVVARVGGDEIVVWSVGTTIEHAEFMAGRLVAVVSGSPIESGGQQVEVTCTVGVGVGKASERRALIGLADSALYAAKDLGRNRWASHD